MPEQTRAEPFGEGRAFAVDLRAAAEAGAIEMFIPYDVETFIGIPGEWGFREIIRPTAFVRAIAERQDVVAWYQHGDGGQLPLGRVGAETLVLEHREDGLLARATPPNLPWVDAIRESIKRGDVNGSSFAFWPVKGGQRWTEVTGEDSLRELIDVDLFDTAPVVFPAYGQTWARVRSMVLPDLRHPKDVLDEHRAAVQAGRDLETRESDQAVVDLARASLDLTHLEAIYPHIRTRRSTP